MACRFCGTRPVAQGRCAKCFVRFFERRVATTIREQQLLKKTDRILVAASGGKDSLATIHVLKKFSYDVHALAVDEGIAGYREHTLRDLKTYCDAHAVPLKIVRFSDEGRTLDEELRLKPAHPCSVCGVRRRNAINAGAKGYDVVATGHNADDEAQAVLMNLVRANTQLFARQGPATGSPKGWFVQRVKPLYFLTEKEVMTYALLEKLPVSFHECPYAHESLRAQIRDALNEYAAHRPGAKTRVLENYLVLKRRLKVDAERLRLCERCGEPASAPVCRSCAKI